MHPKARPLAKALGGRVFDRLFLSTFVRTYPSPLVDQAFEECSLAPVRRSRYRPPLPHGIHGMGPTRS